MEAIALAAHLAREKLKNNTDCDEALRSALTNHTTSEPNKTLLERNDTTAVLDGYHEELLTTINNDKDSRLLGAPAEIRHEIWLLVLSICEPVCLNETLHCGAFHSKPRRFKVPKLLHVHQQIRYEAASLFYSKSTFLSLLGNDYESMPQRR